MRISIESLLSSSSGKTCKETNMNLAKIWDDDFLLPSETKFDNKVVEQEPISIRMNFNNEEL